MIGPRSHRGTESGLSWKPRENTRGGKAEKLEGSVEPKRFVVLEFPSLERAKAWWNAAEYREPKAIRPSAANCDTILVEGV